MEFTEEVTVLTVDPNDLSIKQVDSNPTAGRDFGVSDNLKLPEIVTSDDHDDDVYYGWQRLFQPTSKQSGRQPRKRGFQDAFPGPAALAELPPWIAGADLFPEFLPSIPALANRVVHENLVNPFLILGQASKHPALQDRDAALLTFYKPKKATDAFIKVQWIKQKVDKRVTPRLPPSQQWQAPGQAQQPGHNVAEALVTPLPPSFGDIANVDNVDRGFHKFFLDAICAGRTVIDSDNAYKADIAPMAEKSDFVKHSILALSTAYILDFNPNDHKIKAKAAHHHQMAIAKLGEELENLHIQSPGQEEAVCAGLSILRHCEVVCWESSRPSESAPKWYLAGQLAERLMSVSDPAYRYHAPVNIQCTRARTSLTQIFALENICSDCFHPFDFTLEKCSYPWLLEGNEREQRTIGGATGFCPKLLHYFAKITFLSGKLTKNLDSEAYPLIANEIGKRLENFWQRSDLSEGYLSRKELLDSCVLDGNGTVSTQVKVAELIGESYVCAAQIYLQCRFFRRRREHPFVQATLKDLLLTIDRQPTSGTLFTAQTPLFAVLVAGVVAYEPADRALVQKWFDVVCQDSRGNVPPTWRGVQSVWRWFDTHSDNTRPEQDQADSNLGDRNPWWEEMVAMLTKEHGRLSLS